MVATLLQPGLKCKMLIGELRVGKQMKGPLLKERWDISSLIRNTYIVAEA